MHSLIESRKPNMTYWKVFWEQDNAFSLQDIQTCNKQLEWWYTFTNNQIMFGILTSISIVRQHNWSFSFTHSLHYCTYVKFYLAYFAILINRQLSTVSTSPCSRLQREIWNNDFTKDRQDVAKWEFRIQTTNLILEIMLWTGEFRVWRYQFQASNYVATWVVPSLKGPIWKARN